MADYRGGGVLLAPSLQHYRSFSEDKPSLCFSTQFFSVYFVDFRLSPLAISSNLASTLSLHLSLCLPMSLSIFISWISNLYFFVSEHNLSTSCLWTSVFVYVICWALLPNTSSISVSLCLYLSLLFAPLPLCVSVLYVSVFVVFTAGSWPSHQLIVKCRKRSSRLHTNLQSKHIE
jgi:hypothetical protein